MVVLELGVADGRGVQDKIVGRIAEGFVELGGEGSHDPAEIVDSLGGAQVKMRGVAAGEDGAFEGQAGGVRRDDDEMLGAQDDAGFVDDFMLDDVAEDAAVAELEVAAGAVDFLLNALWERWAGR